MTVADLASVLAVQSACYQPRFQEPLASFAFKLARHPDSAWVAVARATSEEGRREARDDGETVAGYCFAQGAQWGCPPPLGDQGNAAPQPGSESSSGINWVLHVHDVAVAPWAQGKGVAGRLMRTAMAWGRVTKGWTVAQIVAVQGSVERWGRMGYVVGVPNKDLEGDYGEGAAFMWQPLVGGERARL